MKWSLAVVCMALVMALVAGTAAASSERAEAGIDTETLDAMVADVMEADAAVDETAEFEAVVESQDVDAEHAELNAEVAHDAAEEFEWETQDEVEADSSAQEEDTATDEEAEADVAATEQEESESDAEELEDAEEASFLEEEEAAETESEANAEVEAESADESEAAADADADADAEDAAELSADEKQQILSAQPLLEFEEDIMSDAADDAEDAEARAEEAAAEARFRSAAPAGAEYDEAAAKEMLVYAQIAYYEAQPAACAKKLGHKSLRVKHTVATDLSDGATVFGMTAVDKSKNRIVVAFNGNVEPKELTAQLLRRKPLKVKSLCKSCKTHPYYVQAYRKVCPQITASVGMLLRKPALRDFDVWITGHGFGGALAALCGYEMEMARVFIPANKRVFVTFGQPRVGNAHWARKFNQHFPQAIRVTHNDDPFPHVPPCHVDPKKRGTSDEQTCFELKDRKKKLWAFHPPTQVWYPNEMPAFDDAEKGHFQRCDGPNWGEDPSCRHRPLGVSIDDHRNYFGVDVTSHCANLLEPPTDAADH